MRSVNLYQAKVQLNKLIHQVMAGEEVLITHNGKAVASLRPFSKTNRRCANRTFRRIP